MTETFTARMNGYFKGILQWRELDALWERLRAQPDGWYASLAGEVAPTQTLDPNDLQRLVAELDALLRREHDYDYCGIVYADDAEQPSLIKIYDPNNLGSSCGCGGSRIPPRWVLSRIPPTAIEDNAPLPAGRKRWWRHLFG